MSRKSLGDIELNIRNVLAAHGAQVTVKSGHRLFEVELTGHKGQPTGLRIQLYKGAGRDSRKVLVTVCCYSGHFEDAFRIYEELKAVL